MTAMAAHLPCFTSIEENCEISGMIMSMQDRRHIQGKRPMGIPWAAVPPGIGKLSFLLTDIQATKPDGNSQSVEKTGIFSP